jgi:hypothetical protein
VDDGRNYLLTTRRRYDIITSEPMPPTFAGMVNLYSREYYQLARRRLAPGGVLAQWLPIHLVTREEAWAILRTVQEVFPHTTLWLHNGTGIVVARQDRPVTIDLSSLSERLESAALRQELTRLGVPDREDLVDLYALGPDSLRRLTARAGRITDDHPTLEFHPPRQGVSPYFGHYRFEMARSLEAIYLLRGQEVVPLAGAAPGADGFFQQILAVSTHAALGDLYAAFGFADRAQREHAAGLARATTPVLRSRLLFVRARLAYFNGLLAEARRLLDDSLALAPNQAAAVALEARLREHPPPGPR